MQIVLNHIMPHGSSVYNVSCAIGLNYNQEEFLMIEIAEGSELAIIEPYFTWSLFHFRQLTRLEEKMTCDIAMILEVLKARGAGARAIARDDSALTEPQQIQAAGSDTWPSPPEAAQVVIVMLLWNSETFIRSDDLFDKIVFRVNFEIVYV